MKIGPASITNISSLILTLSLVVWFISSALISVGEIIELFKETEQSYVSLISAFSLITWGSIGGYNVVKNKLIKSGKIKAPKTKDCKSCKQKVM